jgi:hypothetical protein
VQRESIVAWEYQEVTLFEQCNVNCIEIRWIYCHVHDCTYGSRYAKCVQNHLIRDHGWSAEEAEMKVEAAIAAHDILPPLSDLEDISNSTEYLKKQLTEEHGVLIIDGDEIQADDSLPVFDVVPSTVPSTIPSSCDSVDPYVNLSIPLILCELEKVKPIVAQFQKEEERRETEQQILMIEQYAKQLQLYDEMQQEIQSTGEEIQIRIH